MLIIQKKIHRAVFESTHKAAIKGVLAGRAVAMVTFYITKMIATYSLIIGQLP